MPVKEFWKLLSLFGINIDGINIDTGGLFYWSLYYWDVKEIGLDHLTTLWYDKHKKWESVKYIFFMFIFAYDRNWPLHILMNVLFNILLTY